MFLYAAPRLLAAYIKQVWAFKGKQLKKGTQSATASVLIGNESKILIGLHTA